MDEEWKIGENMIVVGGGNVAFDVARTSVRNGAKKVTMVCLETRDEQTADEFEIEDGMEEGITIINRVGPISVERNDGRVTGLRVQQIYSLFDLRAVLLRNDPQFAICDSLRHHRPGHWTSDGYELL